MKVAAELKTGQVTDLNADGEGVLRDDGKVVFVRDALPGESISYRLRKRRRRHDNAVLEEVLTSANDRVEPGCAHFGVCGGCSLQHLDIDAQRSFKQQQLLNTLAQIGETEPAEVAPPVTGPDWGYRRRARLGAKRVEGKGRTLVGFRERDVPYIADIQACEVLVPEVGHQLELLQQTLDRLTIRNRLPQIEVAAGDNGIALVMRILDPLTTADRAILDELADQTGWWLYLQPAGPDSVRPMRQNTPTLHYALPDFDVHLAFEPTDFIQINGAVNRGMVTQAIDWLAPESGDTALELFAGLGNFSLPLARRGVQLTTVEGEAGLVERARANAQHNGLSDQITAEVGDLYRNPEELGAAAWAKQKYSLALLDPPRSGAREVLPIIDGAGVERLLYVSCHPGSLARDAGILTRDYGFTLECAGILDMFPHTKHVEAMALFTR